MNNEQMTETTAEAAIPKPRLSRLGMLVTFIAAAFAAWIFISANSG